MLTSSAALWPRLPQAPGAATEPLSGPPPPQFPVHAPHWCAGHWLASGVEKVSAPRASVRALERCHRRHASLRIVLAASPARCRRHPLKHRAHVPGRAP